MYVKFFRWATDRLDQRDGIVCFVSNNSFVDQQAFDGMRKHLARDFEQIIHLDLHGNVRRNPKLSGTTHNVFAIQVGVGITLAIKKRGLARSIKYFRVPEMWRRREKLDFLTGGHAEWRSVKPDGKHNWIQSENADEYGAYLSLTDIFDLYTVGVKTNRDDVVYDWNRGKLAARIKAFIADYNAEVYRHKSNPDADWPDQVKWSRDLKQDALRGKLVSYSDAHIRISLYRAFTRKWLYLDRVLNEEVYRCLDVFANPTLAICCCIDSQMPFSAQMTDCVPSHAPGGRPGQCFPLSHLADSALTQFRQQYTDDLITKGEIFHYIYAILHHAIYRERYGENLKRELPRIAFAPDFHAFADAGNELATLHLNYESLEPWPLESIERKGVPFSERITKMKLSKDRTGIQINESLTLAGIPPEVFSYKLGSKSALEWVIDQYQIKGDSDPNREDDPGYIVRLVGQVIRVSIETVRIVNALPPFLVQADM
jgi:predicted helicase